MGVIRYAGSNGARDALQAEGLAAMWLVSDEAMVHVHELWETKDYGFMVCERSEALGGMVVIAEYADHLVSDMGERGVSEGAFITFPGVRAAVSTGFDRL